jgi:hypothetical protein
MATTEEEIHISITGLTGAEHELRRVGDGANDAERATEELREELRRAEEQAIRTGVAYRDVNGQLRDMQHRAVAVGRVRPPTPTPGGPDPGPDPDPAPLHWIRRFGLAVGRFSSQAQVAAGEINKVLEGPLGTGLKIGVGAAVGTTALAAAGGATIGAAGAGAVGAGVAGALKGPNAEIIKSEFGELVGELKGRWVDSTADWWQPVISGIGILEQGLDEIPIEQIFADAAKYIEPLAKGISGLVAGTGKGIAALVKEAGPVVDRLGKEFDELGGDVETAFTAISQGADGGADALGDLLDLTGALIQGFGMMVLGAEHLYKTLEEAPVLGWMQDKLMDFWTPDDEAAIPAFARDLDGVAQSADGVAQGGKAVEDAWEGAAAAMQDAADTADRLFDAQMGAVDASVAWEQSIDDLTDSIKENGRNWDITTQKGRDNTTQLMESINAAKAVRDANIENGMSVAEANRKYEQQIAYLESVARKAGMTKEQFDAMTKALLNYINTPQDKTITTKFVDIHYVSTEGRIGSGEDPRTKTGRAYASGGEVAETGFSLVGEQGPELRFLSKGDYIATAAQTKAMLSGGGGGGVATIRVILQYPDGRVIRDELVTTAANQGQDVASYLGV